MSEDNKTGYIRLYNYKGKAISASYSKNKSLNNKNIGNIKVIIDRANKIISAEII